MLHAVGNGRLRPTAMAVAMLVTLPMAIEASVAPEGSITGYFFDVMVLTLFTQTLSTYTDREE